MFLSLTRDVPPSRRQNSGPHTYVCWGTSVPPPVVDLQSSRIVRTLDRYREDLPFLLAGAACDGDPHPSGSPRGQLQKWSRVAR
jgi:hypothetical protein